MKTQRVYHDYVRDIIDHAEKAMRFVHGVTFDDFGDNEEKIFAVVRALEIIGEAARHIPKAWRDKYPRVPWKQVVGMRDKITHEYFAVDLEVVWKTLHEDLPLLHETATAMLKDLTREEQSSK